MFNCFVTVTAILWLSAGFTKADDLGPALDALYGTCMAPNFKVDNIIRFAGASEWREMSTDLLAPLQPAGNVNLWRGWLVDDGRSAPYHFLLMVGKVTDPLAGQIEICGLYLPNVNPRDYVDQLAKEVKGTRSDRLEQLGVVSEIITLPDIPHVTIDVRYSIRTTIRESGNDITIYTVRAP